MGCWGYKSYENDHTMDLIDNERDKVNCDACGNVHLEKMHYRKIIRKILRAKMLKSHTEYPEAEAFLGVTIHAIEKDKVILSEQYLMVALKAAIRFLKDSSYLDEWKNSTARRCALMKEIKIITGCFTEAKREEVKVQLALGSLV